MTYDEMKVRAYFERRRALRIAYYEARKIACALLEPHGLTPSRYQVLAELDGAGARGFDSKTALAKKLGVSSSSVHRLVRDLVTDSLVACTPHAEDFRQNRVTLTVKGRQRFVAAKKAFDSADMVAVGCVLQAAMGGANAMVTSQLN